MKKKLLSQESKAFKALMRSVHINELVKELALYVECTQEAGGSDPTSFCNLYLEGMRVPQSQKQLDDYLKFLEFIIPLGWDELLEAMKPVLDKALLGSFEVPGAKKFYEDWKNDLLCQIVRWWGILKHPGMSLSFRVTSKRG